MWFIPIILVAGGAGWWWWRKRRDDDDGGRPPAWDECTLASCWWGANASHRGMNLLSPHFSDEKFRDYLERMASRGCNTVHAFLCNKGDGEGAGYCIYGREWDGSVDQGTVDLFKARIRAIRKRGQAFVPWMKADDSSPWAKLPEAKHVQMYQDCQNAGLFEDASYVVVALEIQDQGWSRERVVRQVNMLRAITGLKVATHEVSRRTDFAVGDLVLWQCDPGEAPEWIEGEIRRVKAKVGGPVGGFELSRQPDRARCEAAFRGGAWCVGNWDGGPR